MIIRLSEMNTSKTTVQVAKETGYSRSRIIQVCRKADIPKRGNQYVLSDAEIAKVRALLGHRPSGRPRKGDC